MPVNLLMSAEIGRQEKLLITDAAHLAVIRSMNLAHLATDDADLFHVKDITVWTLQPAQVVH